MRQYTADTWASLLKLVDSGVFAWLVLLEAETRSAFFLTGNTEAISYAGKTWQPFPLTVGVVRDAGRGDVPSWSVSLSNIGRLPMPYLESRAWDQGQAQVFLVAAANPDATGALLRGRFRIQGATATHETVTISSGHPNFFAKPFPARRYVRKDGFPGIVRNAS